MDPSAEELSLLTIVNSYPALLKQCIRWHGSTDTSHYHRYLSRYLKSPTYLEDSSSSHDPSYLVWILYMSTVLIPSEAAINIMVTLHAIRMHYHILFSEMVKRCPTDLPDQKSLVWRDAKGIVPLLHCYLTYSMYHCNSFSYYLLSKLKTVSDNTDVVIKADLWNNNKWISYDLASAALLALPYPGDLRRSMETLKYLEWRIKYPNTPIVVADVIVICRHHRYCTVPVDAVVKWPFLQRALNTVGFEENRILTVDLSDVLSQRTLAILVSYLDTCVSVDLGIPVLIPALKYGITPASFKYTLSDKLRLPHVSELVNYWHFLVSEADQPLFNPLWELLQFITATRTKIVEKFDAVVEQPTMTNKVNAVKELVRSLSAIGYSTAEHEKRRWQPVMFLTLPELIQLNLEDDDTDPSSLPLINTVDSIIKRLSEWHDHATIIGALLDISADENIQDKFRDVISRWMTNYVASMSPSDLMAVWCHKKDDILQHCCEAELDHECTEDSFSGSLAADVKLSSSTINYSPTFPVDVSDASWAVILQRVCDMEATAEPGSVSDKRFLVRLMHLTDDNDNTVFHILLKYSKIRTFTLLWSVLNLQANYPRLITRTNALNETLIHLLVTYPVGQVSSMINDIATVHMQLDGVTRTQVFDLVTHRGNSIHYACMSGHRDTIKLVLQNSIRCDPDALMDDRFTYFELLALHSSMYDNSFIVIQRYFNTNSEICLNEPDELLWSPSDSESGSDIVLDIDSEDESVDLDLDLSE